MAIKEAGWRQSQTETDARLEDTVGGKTFCLWDGCQNIVSLEINYKWYFKSYCLYKIYFKILEKNPEKYY